MLLSWSVLSFCLYTYRLTGNLSGQAAIKYDVLWPGTESTIQKNTVFNVLLLFFFFFTFLLVYSCLVLLKVL